MRPTWGQARITAHGEPSAGGRPRSRGSPRRRRRRARSEIKDLHAERPWYMPLAWVQGTRPWEGGPMEAGGVRPGQDPFLRAEIVHSSGRTRVTRLFLPGRTVVRKEPLGPSGEGRVRHEAAMLERLRGVAGGGRRGAGAPEPRSGARAV